MKFVIIVVLLGILTSAHALSACFWLPNGTLLPNPAASNEYFICSDGVPIPVQCQHGLVFCQMFSTCLPVCFTTTTTTTPSGPITPPVLSTTTTPAPTTPAVNKCQGVNNNVIFPLEGSCSGYIRCLDGKSIIEYCMSNRKFNAQLGFCSAEICVCNC